MRSKHAGSRIIAISVSLIALAYALVGCSTSPSVTSSVVASPTVPAPTATPTLAPPTATSTPALVAGAQCVASQLTLIAASEGAASGHVITLYHFTNTSQVPCVLRGYPNAQLLDANNKPLAVTIEQVAQAYTWNTTPVTTITLAAGGSAWFRAQTSNVTIQSGVTCPVAAKTIISPPGVSAGFDSSIQLSTCDGKVYLSPLVANASDL